MNKTKEQNENEKTIVALYARESSKGQEDKDLSTPAQLAEMKKYCKNKGWIVYDEFVDRAKSGTNDKRKSFQELIYQALKKNPAPFNKIIVWKLSRFARNKDDSRIYKARLRKKNISVHSMTQEEINDDGIAGYIVESVYEAMDEQFSKELGQDVKRGHFQVAEEGYYPFGGMPHYGYKFEKTDFGKYARQKLIIEKEEAFIVQKIFELSGSGFGGLTIAQYLNNNGFRNRRGKTWSRPAVLRILRNERYTGSIVVQNKRYENSHPSIISKEMFLDVQQKIKARSPYVPDRKIMNSSYVLSGLMVCGHCGQKMNGYVCKGRHGKDYHYYACQTYLKKGRSECSQKIIRQKDIEIAVQTLLEKHVLTEKHLAKVVKMVNALRKRSVEEDLSQRTSLVNQVKSLKAKINHIDNIVLDPNGNLDLRSLTYYTNQLGEHLRELDKIQMRLDELDNIEYNPLPDGVILKIAKDFEKTFKDSNLVMRKSFLSSFIEKIIIKDEQAKLIYSPPIPDEGLCLSGNIRGRRDSNPRLPA